MWGDNKTTSKTPSESTTVADKEIIQAKPAAEQPSQARTKNTAIIGRSVSIHGTVKSEEDVIILGHVKGEIELKNNSLTIGRSGCVEANILAKNIQIEGEIIGDIYAHQVNILKTGKIFGNILAPRITLEDGAKFKGSVDMDEKIVEEKLGKLEERISEPKPMLVAMTSTEVKAANQDK